MNKTKAIVVLVIMAIFLTLMITFAVVDFPIGNTVYDYTGYAKTISLGMDLSGGIEAVYLVTDTGDNLEQRISGTVSSMQSLLIEKGYTEAVVSTSEINNNHYITVQVPNIDDPERLLNLIGRPASLEFRSSQDESAIVLISGKEHLDNAYVTVDSDGEYAIGLQFNAAGTKKFAEVTQEYEGKTIYIYVNDSFYTSVNIKSVIANGQAIITNSSGYTYQEAYDFATKLQSGTFGVDLTVYSQSLISASLGQDVIKWALVAGAIGIGIIMIFMIVAYRLLGLAADIALAFYVVVLVWFCAVLPWVQLTLAGIAGILLSIGMAVDANVIIFERIQDEYKNSSKSIQTSIKTGFKRSVGAIVDGNVTTIIGAVVLWIVGAATATSIVGFAVTLFIGILLSMFTALIVTRLMIKCFIPLNNTNERLYGLKRGEVITEDDGEEDAKVENDVEFEEDTSEVDA